MVFSPGARIGPFEILAQLGVGGMGEVYRARDTRLGRIVALKVLSDPEKSSSERVERFKREARAISRVSHQHICQLYDIGQHGATTFLVMEYVQGETLADRLKRGPLKFEDALRYGIQMAEALNEAHRAEIVHRDLKPSNVMLARDGPKLLDFGLAKLRAGNLAEEVSEATASMPPSTSSGLIVGTVAYMAPEQLEGKAVDARADLFALGGILYEMTTGERPFRGDSTASLIAAILTYDPAPLRVRQPLTPASFDWAVRRCLAKNADERWQTARDFSAGLSWILTTLQQDVAPARSLKRRRVAIVGASAAAPA